MKEEFLTLYASHATLMRKFPLMANYAKNAHPIKSPLFMVFAHHAHPVNWPEMEEHAKWLKFSVNLDKRD